MAVIIILSSVLFLFILILIIFRKEIGCIQQRDPAAKNRIEVLLTYSGLHALILHRIAHAFWYIKIPFFPRFISQFCKWFTGIEIHPGATIGNCFFIDHGIGVVIGETSIIGDNVTMYQGVTLGGTGKEKGKRHPTIGNNVLIGAGAKILGNIKIGNDSYIGANAVVIKNVPHNSTVVGVPGRISKQDGKKIELEFDHIHVLDPLMQTIVKMENRIKSLEKKLEE